MRPDRSIATSLLAWAALAGTPAATAQPPDADAPATAQAPDVGPPTEESSAEGPRRLGDPYSAYEAGAYDEALAAFVDRQIERPEDPELALNLGATYYQMRDYASAERAFSEAARSGDDGIRAEALYNLGNSAYRQGRLEEAVERYQATLELVPSDEDAKFNLEYVRDEIRRRHEEAQKRQQEQQDQQQDQQEQQQDGDQQGEGQQQQQEGGENQEGDQPQDSDGDGLGDDQERSADNPTDPQNADTDGDGLEDGREDLNANGKVDPGETDPNQRDSDGDGVPDGEEAAEQNQQGENEQGQDQQGQGAPGEQSQGREMTPEEAERFLAALEEGRADPNHRAREARRARPEKDW